MFERVKGNRYYHFDPKREKVNLESRDMLIPLLEKQHHPTHFWFQKTQILIIQMGDLTTN